MVCSLCSQKEYTFFNHWFYKPKFPLYLLIKFAKYIIQVFHIFITLLVYNSNIAFVHFYVITPIWLSIFWDFMNFILHFTYFSEFCKVKISRWNYHYGVTLSLTILFILYSTLILTQTPTFSGQYTFLNYFYSFTFNLY